MKYVFMLNKFGNKDIGKMYRRIKIAANSLGLDYTIEVNSEMRSTEYILKKYQHERRIIVAVGGDGMINKVINGIADTNNAFGYIPYGTGNDLDRTVNETLDDGEHKLDLVKINDKYFINTACFGIDAEIACDETFILNEFLHYLQKYNMGLLYNFLNSQKYNIGILYHFLTYHARPLEIIINGETIADNFTTVVVCNGRYYGGGYKIAPHAILDDNKLDVYLVKEMNKIAMAKTILSTKDGSHEQSQAVRKIDDCNSLIIKSPQSLIANIDGDSLEDETFDINIVHNGITIFNNKELLKRVLQK